MKAATRHRSDSFRARLLALALCGCVQAGQSGTDTSGDRDCPFEPSEFQEISLDRRVDSLGLSAREIYAKIEGLQLLERCGAAGSAALTLDVARGQSARLASNEMAEIGASPGARRRCEQLRLAVQGRLRSSDGAIDRVVSEAVVGIPGFAQLYLGPALNAEYVEYDFRATTRTATAWLDDVHYVSSELRSECSQCVGRTPREENESSAPQACGPGQARSAAE
jgi:hypothetical protein